ncbi:MAG: serine/threonine-protein kinase [Planctomycetaceae bacterium]
MFIETVQCPSCGSPLNPAAVLTMAVAAENREVDTDARVEGRHTEVMPADSATTPALKFKAPPLPWKWGRYQVVKRISQGGFGSVYLARDEMLGRDVALKIPRVDKIRHVRRLDEMLAEARTLAGLSDPGIVTVFDVGVLPEAAACIPLDRVLEPEIRERLERGIPFIAMRLLEGDSLHERIARQAFQPREAAHLVEQLAQAMGHAHQKGLVHRDLKPDNIVLDGLGRPQIIDFGLAVEETNQLNLPRHLAGTRDYMSPEQVQGLADWLDARCDIWALGVILYELLTGQRPFRGTPEQIHEQILYREPKPPRQSNPAIPAALEEICLKCLRKKVDERYNTAADLAEALQGLISPFRVDDGKATSAQTLIETGTFPEMDEPVKPRKAGEFRIDSWRIRACIAGCFLIPCAVVAWRWMAVGSKNNQAGLVRQLQPQKRIELLDREPESEVWNLKDQSAAFRFDPQRSVFQTMNQHFCAFSVLENDSGSFDLQLRFFKNSFEGETGLYWGGHWRDEKFCCQAILIARVGRPGEHEFRITRQLIEVSFSDVLDQPIAHPDEIQAQVIAPPLNNEAEIEISVLNGRLTNVKWNRQSLTRLVDGPHLLKPVDSLIWPSVGRVGVCNSGGGVVMESLAIRAVE